MKEQCEYTENMPKLGEISPKQLEKDHSKHIPKLGEISPKQLEKDHSKHTTPKMSEISPTKIQQITALQAMEEGAMARTTIQDTRRNTTQIQHIPRGEHITETDNTKQPESPQQLPQGDSVQQYLDENFSDVMRTSVLGSNISSLFNTTAFSSMYNKPKITLDWILPDGKSSQLETLVDKHIANFPVPGGNTGAMLVSLPDLEPFYNTHDFLVNLQSGELLVMLKGKWHPAGLSCKKRNFDVDQLMALIQHASIRLKNQLYGRSEEQTAILTLDLTKEKLPPLPFIPDTASYTTHSKPMSPTMRKNYIKDRAQAAVTYISEYGNTRLWKVENLIPTHKLTHRLQIVFGRTDMVREKIDKAIEQDDEIRRKKCMHYLKPPKRLPVPEDMENERDSDVD